MKSRVFFVVPLIIAISFSCADSEKEQSDDFSRKFLRELLIDAVEVIRRGEFDSAVWKLESIDSLSFVNKNEYAHASVVSNLAWIYELKFEYDSSLVYYEDVILLNEGLRDTAAWVQNLKQLGRVYRRLGRFSEATLKYEIARDLAFAKNDTSNIASVSNSLGNIHSELENFETAANYYDIALDMWGSMGRMSTYAIALQNKATTLSGLDSIDSALPLLKRALFIKDSLNNKRSKAFTLTILGSTYSKIDSLEVAKEYLNLALKIRKDLKDIGGVGETLYRMAIVSLKEDNYVKAEREFIEVERIAKSIPRPDLLRDSYDGRKELYKEWGKFARLAEVDEVYDIMTDSLYREEKLKVQEEQSEANLQREQQKTQLAEQDAQLKTLALDTESQKAQFRLILIILAMMGLLVIGWQLLQIRKRNSTLVTLNSRIKLITDNAFHSQKNALGLISALLRSKARQSSNEKELEVLKDVEGKIEALGGVAKYLFQRRIEDNTAVAAGVQLKAYLEELVDDTFSSVASDADLDLSVEDIETTSTEALNIGLITNEAVTNFSKYAESAGAETLLIRVTKQSDKLHLSFTDDGPGFPKDFDFSSSTGFGMQMMANLVDDMDGELSIGREDELTQIDIFIPLS